MRILITNDDGFDAAGIKSLKKIALAMSTEDNVFVVAPAQNQSAKSRSVSYKTSFDIIKKNNNEYSVEGTPTDCIIFALEHLMKKKKPDIILSGINWGYNLSEDVFYSGTVAAAAEGTARGILSIALSQAYKGTARKLNPYLFAERCGSQLCLSLYENFSNAREKHVFNVNFPTIPKLEYPDCIKITPIGQREKSNFGIDISFKSQNLYTAKIDTVSTNSSTHPDDDYINCSNGYLTVSPVSMLNQRQNDLDKLKKVKF
ncbi:5'/3'-nucleotidase SurE [Paracoccaceae bacterium]|nr:5'/3'-nucleotidase SurE [Paracoccaceae bacterium]